MRQPPRPARSSDPFQELARRLHQMVHDIHSNELSGAERFSVTRVSPLIIEQVDGDLVLEDGDPDFTVGGWLRQYALDYTLTVGDLVWCVREGAEWHALDVADPGGQTARA